MSDLSEPRPSGPSRGAPPLNYRCAGVSLGAAPPDGWASTCFRGVVAHGIGDFDTLSDAVIHLGAYDRCGLHDAGSGDAGCRLLVADRAGLRGPWRVVDVIDSSLAQGIVLGTAEGNPAVAEHHCILEFDDATDAVTADLGAAWRPGVGSRWPGGRRRAALAQRRLLRGVGRALGIAGLIA